MWEAKEFFEHRSQKSIIIRKYFDIFDQKISQYLIFEKQAHTR